MRVLAIIPAAEGLAKLPNRNLRALDGKPIIYYVLKNAKDSIYIDDVIVTSNSDAVLTVADQIGGVRLYKRPDELCGTEVPLEIIVNDVRNVVDFNDYDYVVTMQSISTTLKVDTLDDALKKCFDNEIDTMISVVEKKNYLWTVEDGNLVSYQQERTSKESRKSFYMETGAFFISRPCYITDNSRIGGKVELYPIKEEEAVDVMTFGDLKEAEYVITKKKIAFYVNGNDKIGMGHIHRVLSLADELFIKPTIFYDINTTNVNYFNTDNYVVEGINGYQELTERLKEGEYNLLINDVLNTSVEYMQYIRRKLPDIKVVNFEDDGKGADYADLVINALYGDSINENWRVGADYYIAPKLYLLQKPIEIKPRVENVIITFGGADPENYTYQVAKIIAKDEYNDICFHIVIGPANQRYEQIKDVCKQYKNITLYKNLNGLISLMKKCDAAICSRGRTGFELAICGIPTMCFAQNAREERHTFLSDKNGYSYIGFHPSDKSVKNTLNELLALSVDERKNRQILMQRHDLKNGRRNVIELINNL